MTLFSDIAQNYDAFLCDLWGVIHDGDELYPGVLEALEALYLQGKKLVFLSNAPRLASSVTSRMDAMGVKREWYHAAMTSGEAAVRYLNQPDTPFAPTASYYYLGLEKDAALLDHIPQKRVETLSEADFILNGNFEELGQTYPDIEPIVQEAADRQLPMLCINPDLEVTKLDGTQILCAGYIAEKYKKLGGTVEYIGKPYSTIYEFGMELLDHPPKSQVLMIGDNVLTDIKGANDFGIDSVFITQGILQNQKSSDQSAEDYCEKAGVSPTYITQSL
jgi:HAD superfamily hydrolase (TIGR01459 family)